MMKKKSRRFQIRHVLLLMIMVGFIIVCIGNMTTILNVICEEKPPVISTSDHNQTIPNEVDQTTKDELYSDDRIYMRLKTMTKKDQRIQTIRNNYENYPKSLLEMLTRNIEMLDFVLDYPSKQGKIYADTIGDLNQGTIPFLLQWDQRWGYGTYADTIIAVNGCAPTVLSMVIAGLTGDETITPYVIATYAETNGYYMEGVGSSWALISAAAQTYGITAEELALSQQAVFESLQSGNPIICSMLPGDFTTTGHFIVLVGIENGKIIVFDPNSIERSEKRWDYYDLEKQINNLWAMYL